MRFVATFKFIAVVLSAVTVTGGCKSQPSPRLRFGAYFGSPIGMEFANPDRLGNHSYIFSLTEKSGMAYTCKAGFIDIGHIREAADRTAYIAAVTYSNIMLKKTKFSYRVIEPSKYWVNISYPQDWDRQSKEERQRIANEVSIHLAQSFAHISLIWHEILTWYGFATAGLFPDRISSFSWEDGYSDLLGTKLAMQALFDRTQKYDDAMTKLIDQALKDLDVQSPKVAKQAAKQIKGEWFTGGHYFFVVMNKRNFDIGLNDGQIDPWLVPGICPDAEPQPCQVPGLELLWRYGFKIELEIEPRVWEQGKIYHAIQLDKADGLIRPKVHFPEIMKQITNDAK